MRHTLRQMTRLRATAGLSALALAALLVHPSAAGTVVTKAGRPTGNITPGANALRVGDQTVPWADVLLAFNDSASDYVAVSNPALGRAVGRDEALHLRNGETWVGEVVNLRGDHFVMQTTSLGLHTGDVEWVRAVDFKPGLSAVDENADGVLYRVKGRPTPGELLWIEGTRAALDTPVGVVAVDRKILTRYVFAQGARSENIKGDEIALNDGSVLRAQIVPENGGFRVRHALLGEKRVGPDAWLWIRRHAAAVTYLLDLEPEIIETFPLIRQPAPDPRVVGHATGSDFVRRMHVSPKTVITYAVPGAAGSQASFCAVLGLMPGAQGNAHVHVRSAGQVAFERTLEAGNAEPVRISFDVQGGIPLEFDVDFGDAVRLPCGITVDDAYVMAK